MSVWEKQDENRRRLLEACHKQVGEKLPYRNTGEKRSRAQVEAEYKRHWRWVERSKKQYGC